MTAAVQPEKILKDLRELWEQLAREQESGVLRACAMTLIVIAEDEADAAEVRQTLGLLMHDHPSRAIVLKAAEGAALGARVFAECRMPFGGNQQICSEGIEMTADAANLGEVAGLLLPLIVPDLPVALWCRGPRFFSTRYFDPLFPLAQKIIADSECAPNARGAIAVFKELRGRRVADLAWTRLTGWRQALANVYDDAFGDLPPAISDARIEYAGPLSTRVLYFSGWMQRCLPGVRMALEESEGEAGIRMVTLAAKDSRVTVKNIGSGMLEIQSSSHTSSSILPPQDVDALVRAELAITGADPVFESLLK